VNSQRTIHVVDGRGPTTQLLFLVHGYGRTELHMAAYAALIDPAGRFTVVAPRGPIELPKRNGAGWALPRRRVPEQFAQALEQLDDLLDEQCAARGIGRDAVVVGGFSQGASLAFALALRAGRAPVGGVVAWCGPLPFDRGVDLDLGLLAGVPVLYQIGVHDDVIPLDALRRTTRELEASAAALTAFEYENGHDVSLDLLLDARAWLERRC
jgi:phospholipase/carboxylesterase